MEENKWSESAANQVGDVCPPVPDVDGMLHRPLPVGVLVHDRGQDFVQMEAVRASDVVLQNFRPPVRLDTVLDVFGVERKVRFGPRHTDQ